MFWELIWSAVLPSIMVFITGMFLLTLILRYEQNRARNAVPAKRRH